jgi:DNA polymerase IV
LKLTDLPGIAGGNAARLAAAGVTTMAALWALEPAQTRAIWGGIQGERFWAFLHGYDIERAPTERCMFGHGRVLAWDWRGAEQTEACARLLLVKAMRRMRREGFSASVLSLALGSEGGRKWVCDDRREPFRDDHTALSSLAGLFARAKAAGVLGRTKKVQTTLHGIVKTACKGICWRPTASAATACAGSVSRT